MSTHHKYGHGQHLSRAWSADLPTRRGQSVQFCYYYFLPYDLCQAKFLDDLAFARNFEERNVDIY